MNLQKEKIVIFMVCTINLFVKLAGLGIEKIVQRWFVIWWFVKKMVCDRARVPQPSSEAVQNNGVYLGQGKEISKIAKKQLKKEEAFQRR